MPDALSRVDTARDDLIWKPGWVVPMVRWVAETFFSATYLSDAEVIARATDG